MSTEEAPTVVNFTPRDLRLVGIVMTCLKEELSIDFDKFATSSGLKNAASARTAWHGIKKKIDKIAVDGSATTEPATPAGKGGKRKKAEDASAVKDEADAQDQPSPPKKAKKTPAKNKKSTGDGAVEGSVEDDLSASPAKKTVKTPAAKGKNGAVKAEPDIEDGEIASEHDIAADEQIKEEA